MELDSNPTSTVAKHQAQPNWAEIGLWTSVLVSVLIGWALWNGVFSEAWTNYLDPKNFDPVPKTEALRNLTWSMGTIGAVFAGFIGLVMAGFRTVALHRQSKIAQRESELNAQKHQSEAFATAIEQLGHENFAVRLGAVYALESLAKSAQELHGPIFETLCAYVRTKAPAPTDDKLIERIAACGENEIDEIVDDHLKFISKPNVVIQAILTVIGRRYPAWDPENFQIDLRKTDLRKCDLQLGNFDEALLSEAYLDGAELHGSHLQETILDNAYLVGSELWGAELENASLINAHLDGAFLSHANLNYADLTKAHIKGANFSHAELCADLWEISFDGQTCVAGADLHNAEGIPATKKRDFFNTVIGTDSAMWPEQEQQFAWDCREDKPAMS